MTNEQREALENLNEIVNLSKEELQKGNVNITAVLDYIDLESLDTVLSLIKEQEGETDKYKALYERALSDLVKADKQIDLIIDEFYKKAKISTKCYLQESVEECMKYKNCKECLKKYFAGLVEKEQK